MKEYQYMKSQISVGDTLIFFIDVFGGQLSEVDGEVLYVREEGVEVVYLEGFRSRNELVHWDYIVAKVDLSMPWVKLKDLAYSGNFIVFKEGC